MNDIINFVITGTAIPLIIVLVLAAWFVIVVYCWIGLILMKEYWKKYKAKS